MTGGQPPDATGDPYDVDSAEEPSPEVQRLLRVQASLDTPAIHELDPPGAREAFASFFASDDPAEPVGRVEDRTIPGPDDDLGIRTYEPSENEWAPAPPVVVYAHGGGFVLGSLETHDDVCRVLCEAAGAIVVSVDYRLAPEHPFPAALEDVYAATEWAADRAASLGGDPGRLVLAAESAGATLVSGVALHARDRRRRGKAAPDPAYQVLLYPVTDHEDHPSMAENAEGYFMSSAEVRYYRDHYLPHELHAPNRLAFPMNARDLSGMPPTTLVTAGFDPIRDAGAAYARRLDEAGVPVRFRNYEGMVHAFASMLGRFEVPQAREVLGEVGEDIRDALG